MTDGRFSLNEYESNRVKAFEGAEPDIALSKLASLVPKLADIPAGDMLVRYALKDDLLVLHIYHTRRLQLRDEAFELAERHSTDPRYINQLNTVLATRLEAFPWPADMETKIRAEIEKYYRETRMDVTFVPEEDSWCVLMPKPPLPSAVTLEAVTGLVGFLSQACFGAK